MQNCDPPAMGLMVLGEENKKLLLCHRISMDDIYQTASGENAGLAGTCTFQPRSGSQA